MKTYLTLTVLLISVASGAEPLFTGPFGPDGTWNLYQLVKDNVTWEQARKQAEAMPAPAGDKSAKGHLVTFSTSAENEFVRLLNREDAWCGLTDDERFGGHEAGSRRREGWKWLDGGTLSFSNWLPDQPDEWKENGTGEDAVFFDGSGRWGDNGSGTAGQSDHHFYFVVEWETHAAAAVSGATAYESVWPEKPVMPAYVPGKWNARWVTGYVKFPNNWIESPRSLTDGMALLLAPADIAKGQMKPLNRIEASAAGSLPGLWLSTRGGNRNGWLTGIGGETNFPELPRQDSFLAAVVGKIHVEKAGTYTFAISATDAFALRIGGLKWKSAASNGYVDPLDPLTITQPNCETVSTVLAVMDLPAGNHLVEALWMAGAERSEFQVLSAPGVHSSEISTADWRPLGHAVGSGQVPSLGISDAGWTVECSMPGEKPMGLQDGLVKLELDSERISNKGISAIDFAEDAEIGSSVFPNETPGGPTDYWPLRATARLVVPKDGIYQINLLASGQAALRIKGCALKDVIRGPQGVHRQADAFDFQAREEIVTTWELKAGEHDIDVFYLKNKGPASLKVASCPEGPYAPSLLKIGGARLSDDVPGLPHAAR